MVCKIPKVATETDLRRMESFFNADTPKKHTEFWSLFRIKSIHIYTSFLQNKASYISVDILYPIKIFGYVIHPPYHIHIFYRIIGKGSIRLLP